MRPCPCHRAGKPISTSRAKGTFNQMVSARVNKHQQIRWSPRGAHRVLQVRAAVLDGRFGHPAIQRAALALQVFDTPVIEASVRSAEPVQWRY